MDNCYPIRKSTYREIMLCPFHFHARENLGIIEPPRAEGEAGKLKHRLTFGLLSDNSDIANALDGYEPAIQDAVTKAVAWFRLQDAIIRDFEVESFLDWNGHVTTTSELPVAMFKGTKDVVEATTNNGLFVTDLKTGRLIQDYPFERDGYALAAHEKYGLSLVIFQYYYSEYSRYYEWVYDFSGLRDAARDYTVKVITPDGEIEERPFWLQEFIEKCWSVQFINPDPKPGDHCNRWFGAEPCHLLGNGCPASDSVPALIEESYPATSVSLIKVLASDKHIELGPYMASHAKEVVIAMQAVLRKVNNRLKEWAKTNGPIRVGDDLYGYHETIPHEADTAGAMEAMIDGGCSWEQVSAATNMSVSSIKTAKGLPSAWKDRLLKEFVTEKEPKSEWGKRKAT